MNVVPANINVAHAQLPASYERAFRSSRVYFIQGSWDRIKIGYSADPASRLINLQSASSTRLSLIRLIDGGRPTEKWLHRKFADRRVSGEWFTYHPDMLTVTPPDEIPVREVVKPQLRKTLRETLEHFDKHQMFEGQDQHLALMLVSSFWPDDLRAFIEWVRDRASVQERAAA